MAFQGYTNDTEYLIPYTKVAACRLDPAESYNWTGYLNDHKFLSTNVYRCPSLVETYRNQTGDDEISRNCSYTGYGYAYTCAGCARFVNGVDGGSVLLTTSARKISLVKFPAQMYSTMDSARASSYGISGTYRIYHAGNYLPSKKMERNDPGYPDVRHSGGVNILFVDGHVENKKALKEDPYLALGNDWNSVQWTGWKK